MPEVEYKFKVGHYAWLRIKGVFRRELVRIVSQHIGEDGRACYVVSYELGTKAQSIVSEDELGVYYG